MVSTGYLHRHPQWWEMPQAYSFSSILPHPPLLVPILMTASEWISSSQSLILTECTSWSWHGTPALHGEEFSLKSLKWYAETVVFFPCRPVPAMIVNWHWKMPKILFASEHLGNLSLFLYCCRRSPPDNPVSAPWWTGALTRDAEGPMPSPKW